MSGTRNNRPPPPAEAAGAEGELVRQLAAAAQLSGATAAIDATDLRHRLLPLLDRDLAARVADFCRAKTLTVRFGDTESGVRESLGADSVRRILLIDPLPDFGPTPPRYSCRPIGALARERFVAFFERMFSPSDLGLAGADALRSTARDLHAGRAIQGRRDYCGRIVFAGDRPIGQFFVTGGGAVRDVGFLGAAPELRRGFALRGALATGVNWMRGRRIEALHAEIAVQNSASLAMARRLGGETQGYRAIFSF